MNFEQGLEHFFQLWHAKILRFFLAGTFLGDAFVDLLGVVAIS